MYNLNNITHLYEMMNRLMRSYQVMLEAEQRKRLEVIARREQRSISSVLREALDFGLEILEEKQSLWEQRVQVVEKARPRRQRMPLYDGVLVDEGREERDQDIERVWRGEL